MRPEFEERFRFKVIYTDRDDTYVVLDAYAQDADRWNELPENRRDVLFRQCPIESVYFKTRTQAIHYLEKYGCIHREVHGGSKYGGKYVGMLDRPEMSYSDTVYDLYFLGHGVALELVSETVCLL